MNLRCGLIEDSAYPVDALGSHPAEVLWWSIVKDCLDTNEVPFLHQEIMHGLRDKQVGISYSSKDGFKSAK